MSTITPMAKGGSVGYTKKDILNFIKELKNIQHSISEYKKELDSKNLSEWEVDNIENNELPLLRVNESHIINQLQWGTKNYFLRNGKPLVVNQDIYNFLKTQGIFADGGMAGLSEVSAMLPNPLPMSTITPMAKGGLTKKVKGDIGKSGTQYGYTLKEWDKMAEKNGLLVSPTEFWKNQQGKKYKDSFGRTKTIGQHSFDKEQELMSYGYRIAIGMDLGSDKIPASAKNM